MPALVAVIHVFLAGPRREDVDGRDKPGHDSGEIVTLRVRHVASRLDPQSDCPGASRRLPVYRRLRAGEPRADVAVVAAWLARLRAHRMVLLLLPRSAAGDAAARRTRDR